MTYALTWTRAEEVADFVLRECKAGGRWQWYQALGAYRGVELVAGCVFTDYIPGGSIEIHVAARPHALWATRATLAEAFRYAFVTNGVRRVTARIAAKNAKSRWLAERLGFEYEGTAKNALPDDDLTLYGLLRENCRFLEP